MTYPVGSVEALKEYTLKRSQQNDDDAGGEPGGGGAQDSLSTSALLETIAELKAQRKKDALKLSALEELAEEGEVELPALRRRLKRVLNDQVEEKAEN